MNNNTFNNPSVTRTPLQPKSINRNIQIESNCKLITPIKNYGEKSVYNTNNKIEKEANVFAQTNIEIGLTENIDDYSYNLNKDCSNHHNKNDKIKINNENFEIDYLYDNLCLASTEEKSDESMEVNQQDSPDMLNKALDFFENENLIYLSLNDIKNREKIDKYIHEDLYFCNEEGN